MENLYDELKLNALTLIGLYKSYGKIASGRKKLKVFPTKYAKASVVHAKARIAKSATMTDFFACLGLNPNFLALYVALMLIDFRMFYLDPQVKGKFTFTECRFEPALLKKKEFIDALEKIYNELAFVSYKKHIKSFKGGRSILLGCLRKLDKTFTYSMPSIISFGGLGVFQKEIIYLFKHDKAIRDYKTGKKIRHRITKVLDL
jgi:hypothetical protein